MIAGFPGETDADHRATVSLVRALPFTYLHVFPYSARPGTAATRLGSPVPAEEIARRAAELRAIGAEQAAAYAASRSGDMADVVVMGRGSQRTGLTEDYLSVSLVGAVLPRGSRVAARLIMGGTGRLVAHPVGDGGGLSLPTAADPALGPSSA